MGLPQLDDWIVLQIEAHRLDVDDDSDPAFRALVVRITFTRDTLLDDEPLEDSEIIRSFERTPEARSIILGHLHGIPPLLVHPVAGTVTDFVSRWVA
jgi:hypothetical protein